MVMSAPMYGREMPDEPWGRGSRRGYGRGRPFIPFWLFIPLGFMFMRGSGSWGHGWRIEEFVIAPWMVALIPLTVMSILALRLLVPVMDSWGRALSQRMSEPRAERAVGDNGLRLMEMELVEARRQIRELEEKVAWQGKLLGADPGTRGRTEHE
jgi:hypothetical protein